MSPRGLRHDYCPGGAVSGGPTHHRPHIVPGDRRHALTGASPQGREHVLLPRSEEALHVVTHLGDVHLVDAGADEVYVSQMGHDMEGFFTAWEKDVLPALR